MKRDLVILSPHFGTNFSGGTLATHEIFHEIRHHFGEIIFLGKKVGSHRFDAVSHYGYRNALEAIRLIRSLKKAKSDPVFFADFFTAYYFILAGVPYYFAYHDNWPELATAGNRRDWWMGRVYIPLYKFILRRSLWTFTVSDFKMNFVKAHTSRCSLVRNGVSFLDLKGHKPKSGSEVKILMVGNIDQRKYGQAIAVLDRVKTWEDRSVEIHIYGHMLDKKLASALSGYSFVKLMGFAEKVPWREYQFLLSTSSMENLSISVVEALFHSLPVIGFDVGGLSEVVKHHKNGSLVPTKRPELLAEEIKEAIAGRREFSFDAEDLEEYQWQRAALEYQKTILQSA